MNAEHVWSRLEKPEDSRKVAHSTVYGNDEPRWLELPDLLEDVEDVCTLASPSFNQGDVRGYLPDASRSRDAGTWRGARALRPEYEF